jgi:ATP-dependent Clp protease ATP-binding subunit ClpC
VFDRFTDRCRKVLGYARQEAERFNHDYIGTEHVLLGIARVNSGIAADVLKGLGLELDAVRVAVERRARPGTERNPFGPLPFSKN